MPVSYGFAEYTTRARASDVALDSWARAFCNRHASQSRGFLRKIKARHTKPFLAKAHIADDIQASRAHKPALEWG